MRRLGKKSLVAGILAMGFLLAGTGYAYWTDTLNVTTKATTGDFGVTFADLGLYAQYSNEVGRPNSWSIVDGVGDTGYVDSKFFERGISDYNKIAKDGTIEAYQERAKGYHNVDFAAELTDAKSLPKTVGPYNTANAKGSDKIEIALNKMYPGYAQAFRTDIINVGDIAAKLSNIKFSVKDMQGEDSSAQVKAMLGVAFLVESEQYKPNVTSGNVFKLAAHFNPDEVFEVGGVKFVRLSALDGKDLSGFLNENLMLCSPATDNRMDLFLGLAMDPDAEGKYTTGKTENMNKNNDDSASQKKGLTLTADFSWDQFNVGKPANATPNILENQN